MKVLTAGLDETTAGFLHRNGILTEPQSIETPDELIEWTADGLYDACVVDLDASSLGIYAARELRSKKIGTPLVGIAQSGTGSWSDRRAQFLENGGDDLIRSPPNPRELVATLRACSRRFNGALLDVIEIQRGTVHLKVNRTTFSVKVNGIEPDLTGKELRMMLVFASAPGRIFSKEGLMNRMYREGVDDFPEVKIIDVFVCKLRKKLADIHPDAEHFIETVWSRGYRLIDPHAESAAA